MGLHLRQRNVLRRRSSVSHRIAGAMGLLPVGGVLETVGALFLLLALRKNFLFWASKDHFD